MFYEEVYSRNLVVFRKASSAEAVFFVGFGAFSDCALGHAKQNHRSIPGKHPDFRPVSMRTLKARKKGEFFEVVRGECRRARGAGGGDPVVSDGR